MRTAPRSAERPMRSASKSVMCFEPGPEAFVHSPGLVDQVLGLLPRDQVEGFSAEEFERCDLARTKAVEVAQGVALDRLLRD